MAKTITEPQLTLDTPLPTIPIVGKRYGTKFAAIGFNTVADLLHYFPSKHLDLSRTSTINDSHVGDTVTLRVTIKSIAAKFNFKTRRNSTEAAVSDNTGSLRVIWFNQGYIAKSLQAGDEVFLAGKIDYFKTLQLTNPLFELVSDHAIHTGRFVPVYGTIAGVPPKTLRRIMHAVLPAAKDIADIVPNWITTNAKLINSVSAVTNIHFPENSDKLYEAQRRLAFDELFVKRLALERDLINQARQPSFIIPINLEATKQFLATLPFSLTPSQKRAVWDIMQDMSQPTAMQRLLEGDVGSGKTLVALLASISVLDAGFDVVLLAPTEILAQQHFQTATKLLNKKTNTTLLTRSNHRWNKDELTKTELLKKLAGKKPKLIIATHAVLQKDVTLKNIALVIIDEQHRFGVSQRKALLQTTHRPHLLSMTATPIPRTLALSWYTNLAISRLTHIPNNRPAIQTVLVPEASRASCYQTISQCIAQGQQVFVVTPRVEETESSELKSVKAEYERLAKTVFPTARVGMVHGQMKAVDKEVVMQQFYNHQLDVLVATSVIEIGIDVPNATVMIIEGAERFGLAQLHQLRGRVGRGLLPSTCYLFTTNNNPTDNERLVEFATIRDGFTLAELDLKQRGFGNLFGTEQSGYQFAFNQFITPQLINTTTTFANKLLQKDPELTQSPELKKLVVAAEEHIHGE